MTTPITDNWIADQEAICEKASKGPWQPEAMFDRAHPEYIFPQYVTGRFDGPDWRKNFDFIASARTALPLALAELRRLREICEAWRLMDAAWPARVAETPEQIRAYRRLEAALAARERGE